MARNPESERRKNHVVSFLKGRLGELHTEHPRRPDWYTSEDRTVDVFVTDSKASYNERPWFDMRDDDLTALGSRPAGFVVFIIGNDTRFLVIPVRDLVTQLSNHTERLTERGFYHFNTVLGRHTFEQLPDWDVYQYLGRLDLIPQKGS